MLFFMYRVEPALDQSRFSSVFIYYYNAKLQSAQRTPLELSNHRFGTAFGTGRTGFMRAVPPVGGIFVQRPVAAGGKAGGGLRRPGEVKACKCLGHRFWNCIK